MRVLYDDLWKFVEQCMIAANCSPSHAATVADILVEADLRGVHSHGVNRLEMYVEEATKGEVDGNAEPTISTETPAIACVDGNNGLGMVVGKYCMELAIKKAKEIGVAWVVCRHSNHYGIAGYYSMMASKQNMIGMSFTNTSPIVYPTRGAKAAVGTNPIAVAAPSTDPEDPFVLDMATSAVALGKVEVRDREERKVPHGWGVNKEGTVSDDPKEILNGGGLLPLGGVEETSGYKGYGLGLMVELFCGILADANYGPKVPPWRKGRRHNANLAQCFVAVNPALFGTGFNERVFDMMSIFRNLPSVGDEPVLIPGDPEKKIQKEYEKNGIKLHQNLVTALHKLGESLHVEPFKVSPEPTA